MKLTLLSKNYFSEEPGKEKTVRWTVAALAVILGLILTVFWEETRNNEFINLLYYSIIGTPLEWIIRGITFIGDDEGHILVIMFIYWCLYKHIGLSMLAVLLSSAVYVYILKEATSLPRPDIVGIIHPPCLSFPSGHTLTVFAVWGYLAIWVSRRSFWVIAMSIAALVGLSRMFLGHHYLGDIIGGIFFGIIFLGLFLWITGRQWQKNALGSLALPIKCLLIFAGFLLLFSGANIIFAGAPDPPKALGIIAGLWIGSLIEKANLQFKIAGKWYQHVLKMVIGMTGIFLIIFSYRFILPSDVHDSTYLSFFRYALSGLWATYVAPLIFVKLGLAKTEAVDVPLGTGAGSSH